MLEPQTRETLRQLRLFLFDMDGTLYLGERLFPFTLPLLQALRASGRDYLFLTNNSSKSVDAYVEKLGRLGIPARREDFMTSSQALCYSLKKELPGSRLYVCGTRSLKEELQREGFVLTEQLEDVDCVVMGFDTELTFRKLEDVCRLLSARPQLPYWATNPDRVCPTEFGSVPDCGSVCQMIQNATGRLPRVIGKPSPLMPQLAMERLGCPKERCAVVGDRIYTDVKSGLAAGCKGILVLSGESTLETLAASPDKPDLVLRDAGEILSALEEEKS